jgi:ABC-type branched-subunit amino acid transport system ATPase component
MCTLAAVALALAVVVPFFAVTVALLVVAFAAAGAVLAATALLLMTQCEPRFRGFAAAVLAVVVLVGGLAGGLLAGIIGDRFGVVWANVTIAFATLSVASNLARAIPVVERDVDAVVSRIIEQQELSSRVRLGHHLPLLSVRHVDFSYGQMQVLFDVSFTVDEGAIVALLGTNGAGKSTLLRVISGLGTPSAGSIHYLGSDITYLGTDRRVERGISQIPGGKAVFGTLPVVDNLRAYGHLYGRQRARLDQSIDEVFDAFPRLAERRNQLASTLSGGEQQMLALGKAFILKPRLLLIDELSLGLAPKVVGELLGMVRQLNAQGTAVVLVEQSVNIALSVVHHAYFMEKGEMRFDGVADELLERPDLLRSVFLQGTAKGMARAGQP